MRKNYKLSIIYAFIFTLLLSSCEYEQEVTDPISTENYPVATITPQFTGPVSENDTLVYKITFDKMVQYEIAFDAVVKSSSTADDHDFLIQPVKIPPYTLEAELSIILIYDGLPEVDETLSFEIGAFSLDDKYIFKPGTSTLMQDLTIKNFNDPTLLTIVFSWETEEDIDIVTWSDTPENPLTEWGDEGATGNNPEIDMSIWLADPVGTYYVSIMHWGVPPFDYTFTLGYPDGTIETITGTFASDNLLQYTTDSWTAWGDPYPSYRVLKVVNDGTNFTVTKL